MLHMSLFKMDPEVVRENLRKAEVHMRFVAELYRMQIEGGRYFVHEHPAGARSWKLPDMVSLMARPDVLAVVAHMCCFGMVTDYHGEQRPVFKPTRFMTNSLALASTLRRRCERHYVHGHLFGRQSRASGNLPSRTMPGHLRRTGPAAGGR